MRALLNLTAPLIISCVCICGLFCRVDIFSALIAGAKKGLRVLGDILPSLLILFPAIYALRSSGLLEALTGLLSPVLTFVGVPPETASLMFLRPFSGSGAMAVAADVISTCGADSLAGRTAAVMLGSSETTFYVVCVYFGAAGIKKSRWAIPAAICADLACFISAAWICRILWG